MGTGERRGSRGSGSSQASGRPRVLSVSSSLTVLTTRTRRSSRVEMVEMPGGAVLVEVDEDGDSMVGRKYSLDGATTVGGISASPDTRHVDKKIKQEIAHHSPAVGGGDKEDDKDSESESGAAKPDQTEEEEPLLAFGATNLFQHLYLALASPAIFRLPALVYKWSSPNGSAFLIAYFVVLFSVALPLSVLEHIMAQFSSLGPTTIFRCLPLFTGVGVGMVTVCLVLGVYTSTVLAWSLRYTVDSLQTTLPWSSCPHNNTGCGLPDMYTPTQFYFLNSVVGAVGGEREGGTVVLTLVFPLALVWMAQSVISYRGQAWQTGVAGRVWALLTVVVLIVFLIYGLGEEASGDGLGQVFAIKEEDLGHPDVWLDAFGQVMWSLGPTLGLLINRASYKHFRARIRLDVYTAVVTNVGVTLLLCLAIFPFMTHLTKPHNSSTPGFFFEMTSHAATRLDVPQLGAVLLYLTTSKALFDHVQMLTSTLSVGVTDLLPGRWRSGKRLFLCHASVCLVAFVVGLPFITTEGIFLVRAIDAYVPWVAGLLLGTLEVMGFVYVYGTSNIRQHFRQMLRKETFVFVFCWKFVLPPIFLGLGVWSCVVGVEGPVTWENLHLTEWQEEAYRVAGVVVSLVPGAALLATTLIIIITNTKSLGRLVVPRETWGPALAQHSALYTPGVLRAKVRAPYLIVQVEAEWLQEGGRGRGPWLPYGFYWFPSKAASMFLAETRPPDITPTRAEVARYLQMQLGSGRIEGGMMDEEYLPETVLTVEGGEGMEEWRMGRGLPNIAAAPTRPRSPSSELVLQANRLMGQEAGMATGTLLSP